MSEEKDRFCCEEFRRHATGIRSLSPMSGNYTTPEAQIERSSDGTWSVNGCCGGGCYVMTGMKFCPFCGASIEKGKVRI